MTIGVIAKIKVQPGKEAEAEEIFRGLQEQVNKNEDGNLFYSFFKSDDGEYIVLESYKSDEALAAHGQMDHYKAAAKKMGGFLAGAPDIQLLKGI